MEPLHSFSQFDHQARNHALLAYMLMIVGLFTGIFWFVGAFWAWVKRDEASGSVYYDHYDNMIGLFWWTLVLSIVAAVLWVVLLGWIIAIPVWLWGAFRLLGGISKLLANQPYRV